MAMATYSSTYKGSKDNKVRLRDLSFSSYLDSTERDFVQNLETSMNNHRQSPALESYVTPRSSSRGMNQISRAELDVFGAERYFNEKLEDQKSSIPRNSHGTRSKHKYERAKTLDLQRNKSTNGTSPTSTKTNILKSPTSSLKSQESWNNSQYIGIKLFPNLQGVCSNKKSIYTIKTQEMIQSPKLHYKGDKNNKYRERNKVSHQDHFAFPIIQSTSYNHFEDQQQQPRKSLEVFGFKHIEKQDISQNIETKLSILAWDAIPNYQNNASFSLPYPNTQKTSQSVKVVGHHEQQYDARSDTSSDLFEIENLSGTHHQSSYATSEASIEWSVVTASAIQPSAASIRCESEKMHTIDKMVKVQKSLSSSLSGGLLGCKSYKAIDVVVGSSNNNSRNYKKY